MTGHGGGGTVVAVQDGFQPGGRLPAPAPLRLVQDFINTEVPDFHQDDLATPAALSTWLAQRGLADANDSVDADLFVDARALRSALRELALANTRGMPPSAERGDEIDAALGAFPLTLRLIDGGPRLVPIVGGARGGLAAIVAVVAETCGWVFYDGSRNHSSSWCSMQVCGGRAKASSYRRRQAAGSAR